MDNLIIIFGLLVNFIGFIILGILFQQITKVKITFLEWVLIIIFVQTGSFLMDPKKCSTVILVLIKDISVIFCLISLSLRHNPKIGIRYHIFYALYPINLYMILQGVYGYGILALFSIKLNPISMASAS